MRTQVGTKPRSPLMSLFGRMPAPRPDPEVTEPFVRAMQGLDTLIEGFRDEYPQRFPLLALPDRAEIQTLVDAAQGLRPDRGILQARGIADETTLSERLQTLHSGLQLTLDNFDDVAHGRA